MDKLIKAIDWAVTFSTDYYKHQTGGLYCMYVAIILYVLLGVIIALSWCAFSITLFIAWELYHKKTENKAFSIKDIVAAKIPIIAIASLLLIEHFLL